MPKLGTSVPLANVSFSYDPRTSGAVVTSAESAAATGSIGGSFTRNVEYDVTDESGYGGGLERPATYGYTRDVAGRVTKATTRFYSTTPYFVQPSYETRYAYRPDGRLDGVENVDGATITTLFEHEGSAGIPTVQYGHHAVTYDARGQLATRTEPEGTYQYAYDEVGRNTDLAYPDGHHRVQHYDAIGRLTSRCYVYPDGASADRCYTATYDAVGNPVRLGDPEGTDVVAYDALDRVTRVTRERDGATVAVETYAYNALGALRVNAGATLDDERPRLDGAGKAAAAVPATLGGQAVTLDRVGQITALKGATLGWNNAGSLTSVDGLGRQYDNAGRHVWNADGQFFLYEGPNVLATARTTRLHALGRIEASFLWDGVDHPLRVAGIFESNGPGGKAPPYPKYYKQESVFSAYYEVDLVGNVRRLRARGGQDLGGYRYSAFGKTLEDTVVNENLAVQSLYDVTTQPLRWKGRPHETIAGVDVYDMRARWWVPELGAFLSVDELAFHDGVGTLWAWPRQNPVALSDPSGRCPACTGAVVGAVFGGLLYASTAPTSMSWGEFAAGAAQAAAVGAGLGALAAVNPQLAFLLASGIAVSNENQLWTMAFGVGALTRGPQSCPVRSGPAPAATSAAEAALVRGPASGAPVVSPPVAGQVIRGSVATPVFEGHGTTAAGSFTVPQGTWLQVPNATFVAEEAAQAAAMNGSFPAGTARVIPPGGTAPNLVLHPATQDMYVRPTSWQVMRPTLLQDMLEPNMGFCVWGACR